MRTTCFLWVVRAKCEGFNNAQSWWKKKPTTTQSYIYFKCKYALRECSKLASITNGSLSAMGLFKTQVK